MSRTFVKYVKFFGLVGGKIFGVDFGQLMGKIGNRFWVTPLNYFNLPFGTHVLGGRFPHIISLCELKCP